MSQRTDPESRPPLTITPAELDRAGALRPRDLLAIVALQFAAVAAALLLVRLWP